MKKIVIAGIALICLGLAGCSSQKVLLSYTPEEITNAIDAQSYQFLARFVQPASGRLREITGVVHSLKISRDEISAELPYFGRAYSAPIGTDGGINFKSRDFSYQSSVNKKGNREVSIRVQNSQVVTDLHLTIFADGSADLRITPVNRRFISYRGEITPVAN